MALTVIEKERVTDTLLVPTMIQMLVDHPAMTTCDASSLRLIQYGAAPISGAVLKRAFAALPGTAFMQLYGMTEMSPVIAVLPPECHSPEGSHAGKLRAAGRATLFAEVRVVDADGVEVPLGTPGEVVARGAGVMQGYWSKPIETAAAIREGWMHTGDGGYLDEDGFLFITDRIKDMIVTGGENVYSVEVENAVAKHPAVAMCTVIGIPDEKWGETVHAVIVLKQGADATEDELKSHCKSLIAGYKCPRSIEFRDEIPLSGAGKLLKYVLRESYWKRDGRSVG